MLKNNESFASRLKEIRGSASQSVFAAQLGIKQTSYSAYERGRMEPSASIIVLICQSTGVTSDWLLGLDNHEVKNVRAEQKLQCLKKAITELLKEY